jgi:2-hydroxycyclohexanecarboxyl-CoA dehydrogenase
MVEILRDAAGQDDVPIRTQAQLVAGVPAGRTGNVHDVADLITYLCREESGYITGATYDVNGGAHIH